MTLFLILIAGLAAIYAFVCFLNNKPFLQARWLFYMYISFMSVYGVIGLIGDGSISMTGKMWVPIYLWGIYDYIKREGASYFGKGR